MTELDTGGNIRLEEGGKNDKWYLSCIDLLKSRFHPEEMSAYNIKDIDIKRIIRIHNRFLKNKFEDRLESLVDMSNNNYKKAVEYLFYGMDPKAPQEIFRIIEEGYRGPAVQNTSLLIIYLGMPELWHLPLSSPSQ